MLLFAPCSFDLSATSQQYFYFRTNQQPASSSFPSEQISTSHQPPAKRWSMPIPNLTLVHG
jgi:hypothetical protein